MDKAWEERSKMRADEITAVSETIKILDADEAHDTFSKSLGFVQVSSSEEGKVRNRVAAYLIRKSTKLQIPKLSMLATSMKNEPFEVVEKNIENLKVTQEEEEKERDFCVKEINTNEDQTTAANNNKADIMQKLDDLKALIASAQDEIAQAKQ